MEKNNSFFKFSFKIDFFKCCLYSVQFGSFLIIVSYALLTFNINLI